MTKKYVLRAQNQLVEVTEEVYIAYYGMSNHEQYLERKDMKNGTMYYSNLDTSETLGEEMIPDLNSPSVEDVVLTVLMIEKLRSCINLLSEVEQELIEQLYFKEKSQAQIERETGVKQQTNSYREKRILEKLKKLLEK